MQLELAGVGWQAVPGTRNVRVAHACDETSAMPIVNADRASFFVELNVFIDSPFARVRSNGPVWPDATRSNPGRHRERPKYRLVLVVCRSVFRARDFAGGRAVRKTKP